MGESSVTIDCFADIALGTGVVTQKLDLDQMSERSIRTLKDTNIIKLTFLLHIYGFFASYDPDWMILMMFPTGLFASYDPDDDSDVCDLKRRVKCPSNF